MRPSVERLSVFLERLGIYLKCPFEGCNMQGAYVDHITSTSGFHFKNLYQRNIRCEDGFPIVELRKRAWEQVIIRGGAVKFNHLDWEILMCKGIPPPSPGLLGIDMELSSEPIGNPLSMWAGEQTRNQSVMRIPTSVGLVFIADLEHEDQWFQVMESASIPTSQTGGWQAIPHVVGGKRHWAQIMKNHAVRLARVLERHGHTYYECSLCPAGRGWEEHIPGPQHFSKICEFLGEHLKISEVRESLWQQWPVRQNRVTGFVRFNHLDGEILVCKNGRAAQQVPSPPSGGPFGRPESYLMSAQAPSASVLTVRPPESGASASQVWPQQITLSSSNCAQSARADSARSMPSPACSLAKCMWRQRLPDIVPRLGRYLTAIGLDERNLTCHLCSNAQMSTGLLAHLGSDSHIDNIARTMNYLSDPCFPEGKDGEIGPRVQTIHGRFGRAWFNHITGECGFDESTNTTNLTKQAGGEWELYDYTESGRGCFWYNRGTRRCFQVDGEVGHDKGLWLLQPHRHQQHEWV